MSNHDDYLALETEISSIPAESAYAPDIPVEVLAKEGEQLCDWVQLDKEAFDRVNFDWTVVTSLKQRIGAAIYAEATWSNKRLLQQDSLKLFNTMRLSAEKEGMSSDNTTGYDIFHVSKYNKFNIRPFLTGGLEYKISRIAIFAEYTFSYNILPFHVNENIIIETGIGEQHNSYNGIKYVTFGQFFNFGCKFDI